MDPNRFSLISPQFDDVTFVTAHSHTSHPFEPLFSTFIFHSLIFSLKSILHCVLQLISHQISSRLSPYSSDVISNGRVQYARTLLWITSNTITSCPPAHLPSTHVFHMSTAHPHALSTCPHQTLTLHLLFADGPTQLPLHPGDAWTGSRAVRRRR